MLKLGSQVVRTLFENVGDLSKYSLQVKYGIASVIETGLSSSLASASRSSLTNRAMCYQTASSALARVLRCHVGTCILCSSQVAFSFAIVVACAHVPIRSIQPCPPIRWTSRFTWWGCVRTKIGRYAMCDHDDRSSSGRVNYDPVLRLCGEASRSTAK